MQAEFEPVGSRCRRQLHGGQCLSGFVIPGCTLGPEDCAEQRTGHCLNCGLQRAGWRFSTKSM